MKPTFDKLRARKVFLSFLVVAALASASSQAFAQQQKRPNIVVLMTDDTGWGDFGYMHGGGKALGHPTPNIDRIAAEGAVLRAGTARRVVPRAARRLIPGGYRFARLSRSWLLRAIRTP